jgi:fluoroquinolone transport system permease protein
MRNMPFVPVLLALALRFVLPPVAGVIGGLLHVDWLMLYPLFVGCVLVLLAPMLTGAVVGFLLLDERDDHTLTALQVTPLPLTSYLAYRLAMPMLLSTVMTGLALVISGLPLDAGQMALCALAAAPLASLVTLFLAGFGANKVQGFALQKAMSVFMIAPLLAAVAPMPLALLFWLVPTAGPVLLIWLFQGLSLAWMSGMGPLGWFAVTVLYQLLVLWLLLRRFLQRAYQ